MNKNDQENLKVTILTLIEIMKDLTLLEKTPDDEFLEDKLSSCYRNLDELAIKLYKNE